MKTIILISAMALGLMGVGCSKSNSGATPNATQTGNVTDPTLTDPNAPGGTDPTVNLTGNTVTLTVPDMQAMRDYVQPASPLVALNNPTNIKVTLNLKQVVSGRYGGSVTISYTDNGQYFTGTLSAGSGRNPSFPGGYDNDRLQADYNYWFTFENKNVFTGYFEDKYGVIVLSLQPGEPTGGGNDGEPLTVPYKGSIYFKNFRTSTGAYALKTDPRIQRPCWFIYTAPFDCRSTVVNTKCGLEPGVDAGYTLLGNFSNVDIKKAFNLN